MACRWRIRHKLMLGLGMVICIMALLVAGTLHGLALFRAAANSIDSKLVELHAAQKLRAGIRELNNIPSSHRFANLNEQLDELRKKSSEAQQTLNEYEETFRETLRRHRDPDEGFMEAGLVDDLHRFFRDLELALQRARTPQFLPGQAMPPALDEGGKTAVIALIRASDDLHETIYADLFKRINESKAIYKRSLTLVLSTCVGGVLLMIGSLRFFYRWTFDPIRDLQAGVGRIAQGDFDSRIAVRSGDEMEELAAAFNDMTNRLQAMYGDLARQVNERSRQLVRSERLASVGFLAAGVAHEINNPLASIALCSEALERRLTNRAASNPEDAEVIAKYLKMIQDEAFRCKKITERLLEFSRSGERRREPIDLVEIIRSVVEVVQHLPISKGKAIAFQPAGPLNAWVNAQELNQVVLNLVVNALESMDEGGRLTITLAQREGQAYLVFADTGCGMTQEVLENIFEPFFTRSRTGKGTGLGLSISHRIITQHGGDIEATSAGPHQGSTFTVHLPLQPVDGSGSSKEADTESQEMENGDREPNVLKMHRRAA